MNSNTLGLSMEVRKLKSVSPSHSSKLVQILDENDSWKFLMSIVPKVLEADRFEYDLGDGQNKKYTADHVKLIENASKKDTRSPAEIFLFEWGHSGRQRPSMGHLLSLLKHSQLYRAADYVAVNILGIDAPERPATGPAAKINILELDAELGDVPNANENPQPSNVTIENNLDNSKPQNTMCRANVPKLLESHRRVPAALTSTARIQAPIVEITEATDSLEIRSIPLIVNDVMARAATSSTNESYHEDSGSYGLPEIVLQTPSTSQSANYGITSRESRNLPNLSDLLVYGEAQSTRTDDSMSNSISGSTNVSGITRSTGIGIDSTSDCEVSFASSSKRPNLSELLVCRNTDFSESISSTSAEFEVSSSSCFRPNLSELLHGAQEQSANDDNDDDEDDDDEEEVSRSTNLGNNSASTASTNISSTMTIDEAPESSNRPDLSQLLDFGRTEAERSANISGIASTSDSITSSSNVIPNLSNLLDFAQPANSTSVVSGGDVSISDSSGQVPAFSDLLNFSPAH